VPTLNAIWTSNERNITHVARRSTGVYVSLAYSSPDEAAKEAAKDQPIVIDDLLADDWEVAEGP
jgi:hypothetical protein